VKERNHVTRHGATRGFKDTPVFLRWAKLAGWNIGTVK
jgi:hypothetical protein